MAAARPERVIVSDLYCRRESAPPGQADGGRDRVRAARAPLPRRRPHGRLLRSATTGAARAADLLDPARCRANGEAYARTPAVLAVIGPYNSGCALRLIPATNAAAGGPLPVVSPTATSTELTRSGVTTPAGLPASLYPAGIRSFARLLPTDDDEGAALAREVKALGAERVVVLTAGSYAGRDDQPLVRGHRAHARPARRRSRRIYDPGAPGYAALARKVAGDSPDAVLVAGLLDENAGAVIVALRARLGKRVELIGSGGLLPDLRALRTCGPGGARRRRLASGARRLASGRGQARVRARLRSEPGQPGRPGIHLCGGSCRARARRDRALRRYAARRARRAAADEIVGDPWAAALLRRNGDVARGASRSSAARAGGSDALQNIVGGATWERTITGRARWNSVLVRRGASAGSAGSRRRSSRSGAGAACRRESPRSTGTAPWPAWLLP